MPLQLTTVGFSLRDAALVARAVRPRLPAGAAPHANAAVPILVAVRRRTRWARLRPTIVQQEERVQEQALATAPPLLLSAAPRWRRRHAR
jgi:hypothetical protein